MGSCQDFIYVLFGGRRVPVDADLFNEPCHASGHSPAEGLDGRKRQAWQLDRSSRIRMRVTLIRPDSTARENSSD
jgi:hypothetical protein